MAKHRPKYATIFSLVFAVAFLSGVFFYTKGSSPATSELSFVEHSSLGTDAGSVIPASCEGGISHGAVICWDGSWIPDCVACPALPACPAGYSGTYPNCVAPTCPAGYSGTYPNCVAPACPSGYTGTYPNCVAPTCPSGYTGTYPNCIPPSGPGTCPSGYTGTPPNCVAPACPSGYTGTYPNCVPPAGGGGTGTTCTDPGANNYGASGSCTYDPTLTAYLSQSASKTNVGESFTLTWDSDVASYCTVTYTGPDGGGTIVTPGTTTLSKRASRSGSKVMTLNPLGLYTFKNVCSDGSDTATRNMTHSVTIADLTAGTTTVTTATAGSAKSFTFSIKNIGTGNVNTLFYNFMQVATDPDTDSTITDLAAKSMNSLSAGRSSNYIQSYTFPSNGSYYVRACADKSNRNDAGTVSESDPDNNCGDWTLVCVGTTTACSAPVVVDPNLVGNHTSQGTLSFDCDNATTYSIVRNEGATGSFPMNNKTYRGSPLSIRVTVAGNYKIICSSNSTSSIPVVLNYDPTALVPNNLSLTGSPRTIEAGGKVTLNWSITNPNSSCKITAKAVCTGTCSAAQTNAATALTTSLATGTTDANDPNGTSRTMTSALQTAVSNSKALGKKTIQVNYTTDLGLTCGATSATSTIRVIVSRNNEG
jgi:hypothetical protein